MHTNATLQDLILALADAARDLTLGRTTASMTGSTKMQDSSRAGQGRDRHWENSEVFFLEPAATTAGRTGNQPFVITGYNAADGTFTLSHGFSNAAGVPSGVEYAIIRTRGQGHPYRSYQRALRYALEKMELAVDARDSALVTANETFVYTIPAGLDTLYDVWFVRGTQRQSLRPDWWDTAPGRQLLLRNRYLTVGEGWTLELHGTKRVQLPENLTDTINVPYDDVVEFGLEFLLRNSSRGQDQQKAGSYYAERNRRRFYRYQRANEREIIS